MIGRVGDPPAVSAVTAHVLRDGPAWFERLDPATTRVRVGHSVRRPRCDLLRLDLSDGRVTASVLAKIRHSDAARPIGSGRPTLMPFDPLDDRRQAELEFAGLGMVTAPDPATGWVPARPLALLPEHAAIVMDHVPASTTLRRYLIRASRVDLRSRTEVPERCWGAAGSWLRHFHEGRPVAGTPVARNADRADVEPLYASYTEFIGRRTGGSAALGRLSAAATALARRELPETFTLVVGHGDFAPRNVLIGRHGSVTVIDPLPRWEVPEYEDLCRFMVGVRCLGVQLATHGLAFPATALDRWERQFLAGYYGEKHVPLEAVRAYQLLILLDKWAATVAAVRNPVRRRWFDAFFRTEAGRLLGARHRPTDRAAS